jgi:hypothetical protein
MRSITDQKKWFLMDWEDAAIAPTKAAPELRPEIHAPQVFQDGHGAEVDIWGVGKLISTAIFLRIYFLLDRRWYRVLLYRLNKDLKNS